MDLRRRINANLAVLCILAAVLAGSGQGNLLLAGATVLAAASSWWWCDSRGRIAVGRGIVNVAVVAIAVLVAARLLSVGGAPDAAVAADGLAILAMVLMFERKTLRTWWDLFSASLLQVFLSCALNHGPLFAVLAAGYFFFALSALALLALYREQQRVAAASSRPNSPGGAGQERRRDRWRLAGVAAATLIIGPLSLYLRFGPAGDEPGGTADGAGDRTASSGRTNGRARPPAREAGASRRRRPGLGREFWWRIGRMTLVSAVVGAVVFCLTPRFGGLDLSWLSGRGGPWRDSSAALRRTVGYSDQVRLGELGSVMEDIQRVMTLRLVRPETGEQYRADGQLFLRGAVLNQYQDGRWAYRGDGESVLPRRILDRPGEPPPDVVRQEIRLDPLDHQELFCLWPFQLVSDDDRLQFHRDLQRLQRPGTLRQRRFSYELATTALADGRQLEIAPAEGRIDVQTLLQWPEAALPRLAALARQWDRESGIAASNPLGRAQALERRLRNSPRFRYRLGDEQRDSRLDPIEDFIANDPRGHCEHFASALALMLRSQGLPARLVVGYKTDEYNSLEQRYWVRQSHAHTWVEAYIPPAAIPAAIRQPGTGSDWSQGAWLRLDPTPSDLAELTWAEYVKATLRKWQISIRTAWLQHVVQMSGARQESLFYRPLIQALRDAARRIAGGNGGGGASAGGRGVADSPWSWMNSPLVLASGSILAGSTLLLLLALRHRRRTVGRRDPRSARVEPRTGPSRGAIEFYRRWEQALDQWGLRRRPAQTPFEFAQEAGRQLAEAVEQPQLRSAALQLVEVFYGVRFGQWELDARAAARAAEALASFQHAALPKPDGDGRK